MKNNSKKLHISFSSSFILFSITLLSVIATHLQATDLANLTAQLPAYIKAKEAADKARTPIASLITEAAVDAVREQRVLEYCRLIKHTLLQYICHG